MDVTEAFLDSWDRHCRIVNAVAGRIDETNRGFRPSDDGMPVFHQLAHMQGTRKYFLGQLDEELQKQQQAGFDGSWDKPITDLALLKKGLEQSGAAIREAVKRSIQTDGKAGWYDNPVLYIQHLIFHEGWHIGLIFLALRLNGQEPPEEWEETNVWGEWRTEVWEG